MFRALCIFVLVSCAPGTPSSSQGPPLDSTSESLVGMWTLESRQDRTLDGAVHVDTTLGEVPLGLLIYDRSGHVAAQLMKHDRTVASGSSVTVMGGTSNNTGNIAGYDAYFGTYTVNPTSKTVTHHLDGALVPSDIGKSLVRHYQLSPGILRLWLDTTTPAGTPIIRTLTFRRVP